MMKEYKDIQGDTVVIHDMNDSHLDNAIKFFQKRCDSFFEYNCAIACDEQCSAPYINYDKPWELLKTLKREREVRG